MGHPIAVSPAPEAPRCPVCGEAFSRSTVVLCRDCNAPHHRKCWRFNKGCATYGCHCRTFVLPPVTAGDEIEFSARGQPNVMAILFMVPLFVLGIMAGVALLPKAAADTLAGILSVLFVPGILGASLGPLLTERRYLLSPEEGAVHRSLWFGPFKVLEKRSWKTFSDVEELEVLSTRTLGGEKGQTSMRMCEVWMRDKEGHRHLLDTSIWSERESTLEKARAAAEVLDTTLGLPREVESARALPAGLARAMAALPARESDPPALPEETEGDGPGA